MADWTTVKNRASGKWQIPLLIASLGLLGYSLLRFRPDPTRMPAGEVVAFVRTLATAGLFDRAADFAGQALARSDLTDLERGSIQLWLARVTYSGTADRPTQTADIGRHVIRQYQQAQKLGETLSADDYVNLGRSAEWAGDSPQAVGFFEEAISLGVEGSSPLHKHLLEIKLERLGVPPSEAVTLLEAFLRSAGRDPPTRLWGMERLFDLLIQEGRHAEASILLDAHRSWFMAGDPGRGEEFHRFEFLAARLLYEQGEFDEAERQLRDLRNRSDPAEPTHAATGWLLGRVLMDPRGRPLEAVSFFEDVIQRHQGNTYAVASRVGLAEAMALMERHEEAIEAFRIAIGEMKEHGESRLVDRTVLRTKLGVTAETQRMLRRYGAAVSYAKLATELLDAAAVEQSTVLLEQLAQVQFLRAEELVRSAGVGEAAGSGRSQVSGAGAAMLAAAAETYLAIAKLNHLRDGKAADATWQAAELLARAGQERRAAELFDAFLRDRPQHPQAPKAHLRLGQLRRSVGDLSEAVDAFQQCYRRFPQTLEGAGALVPLAESYMARGSGHEELAEKALRLMLEESEVFTPQASDFADATFLLGEVLSRRGDHERAIGALHEAMERYPEDPRAAKAEFMLADSYRRSGLARKVAARRAESADRIGQLGADALERLRTATEHYRHLAESIGFREPSTLTPLDRTLLRLSRLYEADGYFETGDYRRALQKYEEATGYKDSAHALAACVQIINSHVFLGQPEEARVALARALLLADAMPDSAFDGSVSPETREDWKRYFEWLGGSEAF